LTRCTQRSRDLLRMYYKNDTLFIYYNNNNNNNNINNELRLREDPRQLKR